jgi:hypothetical protein
VNKNAWLVATVTLALVATACSGGDDDDADTAAASAPTTAVSATTEMSTTTPTAETTTTTIETTTTTTVPDVLRMPLTGVPIDAADDVPDRPALVVKLTNAGPQPRPQAGLNSADIVIEEVINDNVSRLAAVFHSQGADPVGPVRSGRAQDIQVMLAFDRPLFAWSGGNPAVTRAIRDSELVDLSPSNASGFYRRQARRSPNNLYSSTDVLWGQTTDEAGRPSVVFPYLAPGEEPPGESATQITVEFDSQTVTWGYDAETGKYYRLQDGEVHNTEESDGVEQVETENVVVMLADYGVNVFDGNPEAQVLGSNDALVFTGGTVQEGVWLRLNGPSDPFGLFDNVDDLNPLLLQPGRTWLEIPRSVDGTVEWE